MGGALDFYDSVLSGQVTKSQYNQEPMKIYNRWLDSSSDSRLSTVLSGLPDLTIQAKLEFKPVSWLNPYFSYRVTRPAFDLPDIESLTLGTAVAVGIFIYEVTYEKVAQSNTPSANYLSVAGNVRFGH